MSANRELDEIQRGVHHLFREVWVAITVEGERNHVSGIYPTHDEALDATKWNKGVVTITPVRYKVK